ncbi:autotransporter outer membrane beta-barrel domain-containing protein [Ochrobactrum sp. Marseille-Q0166]|uniref:autotransporter outer membrane beta-barrel domain-containing protein n=1 Tax=Ochrobactrum sp. Marseille-Q0166 TaxID=2761105 RepID=UPI00165648D2|nr:autotransporter outer membrane beta-barrel domain-containing protein [Ochrobactrum sp. Marseille-Q0166]MBC8719933.1 autotransporter outer membrane beta-barrel domain-containing protein [Ochrobactrum sp. Marseille-Q0166]
MNVVAIERKNRKETNLSKCKKILRASSSRAVLIALMMAVLGTAATRVNADVLTGNNGGTDSSLNGIAGSNGNGAGGSNVYTSSGGWGKDGKGGTGQGTSYPTGPGYTARHIPVRGGEGGSVGANTISPGLREILGANGGAGEALPSTVVFKLYSVSRFGGGGGGGGGAGVFLGSGSHTTYSGLTISGGMGGTGGIVLPRSLSDLPAYQGGGGSGGVGAIVQNRGTSLLNAKGATIRGGAGSPRSSSPPQDGVKPSMLGAAGDGVIVWQGARFTNEGTVIGGNGGEQIGASSLSSSGGTGIRVGADSYVINNGVVKAGLSYGDKAQPNAIVIAGNTATLELRSGSNILGNVVAGNGYNLALSVGSATLALGGDTDAGFDVNEIGSKYKGFELYKKLGKSKWTLNGSTQAKTGWNINEGVLSVTQTGGLGNADGLVILLGGDIEFTSSLDVAPQLNIRGNRDVINTLGNNVRMLNHMDSTVSVKTGTGALILTAAGNNIYGMEIAEGTLQVGDGGLTGTINGTIINKATMRFNHAGEAVHDVDVSGPGRIEQVGSGTEIFTGRLASSGSILINAGTLQIGDGGVKGELGGNVINKGTLRFNRSDSITYANNISGSGKIEQVGSGKTIFTGNTTSTGTVIISKGILQIGNGGNTGSISSNIINNSGLQFNRQGLVTVNGNISGRGLFEQAGSGTTILTGNLASTGGVTISKGILQVGNGGQTGSIAGAIKNSGTLRFNRNNDLIFSNNVSGAGSVEQAGSGTTILNGNVTAAGGVRINKGTLQIGSGGTTGSLAANITNDSNLRFNRGDSATFSGNIAGKGKVEQAGTGTTTLIGNVTTTGGTTISQGILQVGNGDAKGSLAGNVINDAILRFNRNDSLLFSGNISGSGSIEQVGSGTTILAGNVSSGAGIKIDSGILQIGNGKAAKTLNADIINNAALTFNTSTELVYGKTLSGSGLTNIAAGASLNFGGESGVYSGTTKVHGDLNVTGVLGGIVDVESGAKLRGTGEIKQSATIKDGGTLIGNSGTSLNFGQELILNAGSNVAVYLGLPRTAAVFEVAGPLTLSGRLSVIDDGGFQKGIYPIFSYSGALTGDESSMEIGSIPQNTNRNHLSIAITPDRVNLVNTAGDIFNYWDGSGAQANNIVEGGSGTWIADQQNWTGSDGAINSVWQNRQFAIFSGAAGVVKVDNNAGKVETSGFQALVDGYRIEGDPLTLQAVGDAKPIIAVGAPDVTGANTKVTVASVLEGSHGLVKTMAGTLVLTADNTYSGVTAIRQGTLQLGDGGAHGSVAGDIVIGTETGLRADLTVLKKGVTIFDQKLSGTGGLNITSDQMSSADLDIDRTILTNDNSYTGGTIIHNAALQLGDSTGTAETGSIVGNIAMIDGLLDVHRSGNVEFAGDISGEGDLIISGNNTTILSGDNSFRGNISVRQGSTLQVEDDWNLGDTSNRLALDNATLRLDGYGYLSADRAIEIGAGNATIDVATATSIFDPEIASSISGDGQLIKSGSGTLILSGKNSYSGGTRVDEGTLQLGSDWMDDNANPATGDYQLSSSSSQLQFASYKDLVFGGMISGQGNVTLVGRGMVIFTQDQGYTGETHVGSISFLKLGYGGQAAALPGHVELDGVLLGEGRVGSLVNSGSITPTKENGFGVIEVDGNYTGNNGSLEIDRDLGDDNSAGDKFIVRGDTAGDTYVRVFNRSGIGAQTREGINIIEVGGQSDGTFHLLGDYEGVDGTQTVVAGAYAYGLFKGSATDAQDGNWYLRSKFVSPVNPTAPTNPTDPTNPTNPTDPNGGNGGDTPGSQPEYQAGVPLYTSGSLALSRLNRQGFASLSSRMNVTTGNSAADPGLNASSREIISHDRLFWGRVQGGYSHINPKGEAVATRFGAHDWELQTGIDAQILDNEHGSLFSTVWGDYRSSQVNVWSSLGDGKITIDGYGVGGALTWYGANGFYLDGQGKATWYKSDFESYRVHRGLASDVASFGYALSLEAGHRIALNSRWSVTPQAQMIWASVNTDDYHDLFEADIVTPSNNNLIGRIGLEANYRTSWREADATTSRLSVGGVANIYRDFKLDRGHIFVSDTRIATGNIDKMQGELGITADYTWKDSKYSVYGKFIGATNLDDFSDSYSVSGSIGFRASW